MKNFLQNILWNIDYWRLMNFYKNFDSNNVIRNYKVISRKETTFKDSVIINPQFGGRLVTLLVTTVAPGYIVIFGKKIKKTSKVLDAHVEYYYNPLKQHWPDLEQLPYIKRGNKNNPFISTWLQIKTEFKDFKSQYREIEVIKEVIKSSHPQLIVLLRGESTNLTVPNNLKF